MRPTPTPTVLHPRPILLPLLVACAALTAFAACGDGIAERTEGALQVSARGGGTSKFITFPLTPPGFSMDSDEIEIKNGGKGTLKITALTWEADETGYINPRTSIPEAPFDIEPDQQVNLRFRLAVPSPAESDVALACPPAPAGFPADLEPERYCGRMNISSNAREAATDVIYFLVEQSSGKIKVEPDVITFSAPQVGQVQRSTITISNISTSGNLQVKRINKTDFTGGGGSGDFAVDGFPFPLTLQPGEEADYEVTYTPSTAEATEGKLEIESDDPSASKKIVTIRTGASNAARIAVDPTVLTFPDATPGNPQIREITVTNEGTGAGLTLSAFQIVPTEAQATYAVLWDEDGDGTFESWLQGNTAVIPRSNSRVFQVRYTPPAEGAVSGTLRIRSNADNVPNGEVTVSLQGGEGSPIAGISPSTIIFNVAPGGSETRTFSISNDGTVALELDELNLQGLDPSEFSVTPDPTGTTVAPGAVQAFDVIYDRRPNDIGQDVGSLSLTTNDPLANELVINIRNNNQENGISPTADIAQDPDGAITPGTTVTLDGSGSTTTSGAIAYYTWSLVAAPAGSTARLTADSDPTTTLTPDVPGTYRVQLVVGNNINPPLEGAATRQITVTE